MDSNANEAPLVLENFLPYKFSLIANRISLGLSKYYAEKWDLTVAQWRVMAVIAEEERCTAQRVVEKTAMDKTRVSRAVKSLTERKIVLKRIHSGDKRATDLILSARGYRTYGDITEKALEYEKIIYGLLKDKQRGQMDRILDRLISKTKTLP